ncbi:MAG: hypothetical protein ACRDE8_17545 [Ginsengibacter sp.]
MHFFFKRFCLVALFFLWACHSNETKQGQVINNKDSTEESQPIFPVTEFLLGQLQEIDNLPITPLKIIIDNDKKDSIWQKKKDIRPFATPFLNPVIDSTSMHNFFAEKSFMDQTINAVTLSYDPIKKLPDSMKLNHWDVYIDPQKNTVQRVYMVKEEIVNETTITTQLTWKVNKSCSIRIIKQQPKMAPDVKEEIMKWDFDD